MARVGASNVAIEAARQRRVEAAVTRQVRLQWFINETMQKVAIPMRSRVRVATQYLQSCVVRNISRPVTKTVVISYRRPPSMQGDGWSMDTGRRKRVQRTVVTNRSKKGEFPKADTTQLMKTIFTDQRETAPGVIVGYVGTPLDYGAILETSPRLDRAFLTKTLAQEAATISAMLTGPIQ